MPVRRSAAGGVIRAAIDWSDAITLRAGLRVICMLGQIWEYRRGRGVYSTIRASRFSSTIHDTGVGGS